MLCPTCRTRYAGLADPGCPLCAGSGSLLLTDAAVLECGDVTLARTVEMYVASAFPFDMPTEPAHYEALGILANALADMAMIVRPAPPGLPHGDPNVHDRAIIGRRASNMTRRIESGEEPAWGADRHRHPSFEEESSLPPVPAPSSSTSTTPDELEVHRRRRALRPRPS